MDKTKEQKVVSCAVYARPNRSGDHTVEGQLQLYRSEAEQRGWTIAETHIFKDEEPHNKLALHIRPGFSALMEATTNENRPFAYVMVDATETLSRVNSEVLKAFSELARRGIRLVTAHRRKSDRWLN